MIINQYYPEADGRAHLYKRYRDSEGRLIEQTVTPDDFEPYFWIDANMSDTLVNNTLARYPGSRIDRSSTAKSLPSLNNPERNLVKIIAHRPGEIGNMRQELKQTWEADLRYADRYLIDEYSTMPNWKPRVWHFDLEWDPEHDFTTVMAVVDSYTNEKRLFCWKEGIETMFIDEREIEDEDYSYIRYCYTSEEEMHNAFLDYLDECDPDVLVAHAIMWADLPHLVRRLKDFRRLSPLNRVRRPPKGKRGYEYTDQPILGRLCFDTAAPYTSGTGFERVWKDSGKPQLPGLKLDDIAKELGYGGKFDMDVFTGWYERFDDYCDYCMQDTVLVKRIDEENHVLDFFFSLQRICGVAFESCHNVTRFARGLLSRRTHWKAPTRPNTEKLEYEGAFIPPPIPGRYEGVACVDYKGLYPSIILSHNLSWETQVRGD